MALGLNLYNMVLIQWVATGGFFSFHGFSLLLSDSPLVRYIS